MWLDLQTQTLYRHPQELRAAYPNTSFPAQVSTAALSAFGIVAVRLMGPPVHDPATQTVAEAPPAQIDGTWTQQWTVRDLTAEELQARVPQEVTALQGLLAIDAAGLAAAYESWANDPARSFAERAFIQRAEHWMRDDPTLQGAATALGLTETQLDELFFAASKL